MQLPTSSQQYALLVDLLKAARIRARLTQSDVANELGCSTSFVDQVEHGEINLDFAQAREFAHAAGISFPLLVERFERGLDAMIAHSARFD